MLKDLSNVPLDNQTQGVRTQEVCFDLITYYPVAGMYKWESTVDGKRDKAYTSTDHYTDFNTQIQIALPTTPRVQPTQATVVNQARTVTPPLALPSVTHTNTQQIAKCEQPDISTTILRALGTVRSVQVNFMQIGQGSTTQAALVDQLIDESIHVVLAERSIGGELRTAETIQIRNTVWSKSSNGVWSKSEAQPSSPIFGGFFSYSSLGGFSKSGSIQYQGQTADIFEKIENTSKTTLYLNSQTCLPIELSARSNEGGVGIKFVFLNFLWNIPLTISPPSP